VHRARQELRGFTLECEVDALEQLERVLPARPDIVLLDNMTPAQLRIAVQMRNADGPGIRLEASGGVNLTTVRAIAETGVDRISVGALTHSAVAQDIGLDFVPA
ncbi:MAG TPA: nicotinate-nucleotide diphosphorylase (carboxylating), partial [Gemmataceae bacterium]|jgi:nicotinate-nucleotide pyrophosphorylase (carboxylating)|nr:nicotinate-nucleotide diphosphorylase (carboxylating) [Gemmataceae bacterium]